MAKSIVSEELAKHPEEVDASNIKLKVAYKTYVVMEIGNKSELR